MIPAAPLITLLLSLHTCAREPHTTAYAERLTMIAESIAEVSDSVDDAAGLVAIGTAESSWCESVHSGTRKGGPGEGLWQIEPGSNRVGPFSGVSREATTHAASEALWLWHHTRACRSLGARFGAYAGLGCRSWPGARARVGVYGWAAMRLGGAGKRAEVEVLGQRVEPLCFAHVPSPSPVVVTGSLTWSCASRKPSSAHIVSRFR